MVNLILKRCPPEIGFTSKIGAMSGGYVFKCCLIAAIMPLHCFSNSATVIVLGAGAVMDAVVMIVDV